MSFNRSRNVNKTKPAPSKKEIPNEAQINMNIARTPCLIELTENGRVHLKRLLTIPTLKNINYTQGEHFIAYTLLLLHSINNAYKIFASNGMRQFRMLKLEYRRDFINQVAPYFKIADSYYNKYNIVELQKLIYIRESYSLFLVSPESSCFPKLLIKLLWHNVDFFRDRHELVQFYLFILRHLSITVVEEIKNNEDKRNHFATKTYTNKIEDLTLESIDSMNNYNLNNYYKYKCHIVAAYAVMILDKVLGINSKINSKKMLLLVKFRQK